MRRVVITGMAGISSLGHDWASIAANLHAGRNGVRVMPEWDDFVDLNTRLGAPVDDFALPPHYPRKVARAMGRVAQMAVRASEVALADAGLLGDDSIKDGRMGVAYGSSSGSVAPICAFGQMLSTGSMAGVTSTSYIQMMSHTAAVNIGLYFGLTGRVIPTASACTSGSQALGYAYEAIRYGRLDLMLAGGAEELSAGSAAVFDTLYATSQRNDSPTLTPRPFDRDRDGLVVGEGACTLVLEEREHALARGATIYAEIVGFGTNSDGVHVTQPEAPTMAQAMRLALVDAGLPAAAIGYVNAHGTATARGDVAETQATAEVLGRVPISSLKSYFGHTLGACGALEVWQTVEMMRAGWFAPTLNLDHVDPECGELDYLTGAGRAIDTDYAMSNNFAFGGINTSLILRRA
ncbi:beta-ketoacyl-ACP synthase [Pseudogulbenkiania sp. MAI-1]|uniref:beta-ketoacyl-ACP synthase n=1 Tax=Pseudogulbenkiania sp. MAI-1 TaxID=990370 RepID=UPI00045E6747